jgi:hypothetical protein
MRWTFRIQRLLQLNLMTTTAKRSVSSGCVPVSTAASRLANRETDAPFLIGHNAAHKKRLIGVLVHTYGWVLGQDGNLYAPDSSMAWGERVA